MTTPEEHLAQLCVDLFDDWTVGEEHADDESLRPLYAAIEALIRRGLREQCAQWPREWSTDGIVVYRCARTGIRSIEVIGVCLSFTAQRGAFAYAPATTPNLGYLLFEREGALMAAPNAT